MTYYGQNLEDKIVLEYFNGKIGTLLDIGANSGDVLSNSLALIEQGWGGLLVEPSPKAFANLSQLHKGNPYISCIQTAISDFDGETNFFDSGEHLGKGDTSLLSSLSEQETKRWHGTTTFDTILVKVETWDTFFKKSPLKQFDFISIDAEGMDLVILKQMDLVELGCKCLIIEWNSIPKNKLEIESIVIPQGFKILHINGENLIWVINE